MFASPLATCVVLLADRSGRPRCDARDGHSELFLCDAIWINDTIAPSKSLESSTIHNFQKEPRSRYRETIGALRGN